MKFGYKLILASNSPRRKELLSGLDLEYDIKVLPDIDESFPVDLDVEEVAEYVACKKANSYISKLDDGTLLITADTIVVLEDQVFGKPTDKEDAMRMLRELSGKTHKVITGVCLSTNEKKKSFSVKSDVRFGHLEDDEIEYYVTNYNPLDKAGAYGIQEWIGYIAVENISGSYFNIMGLPVQRLYQELKIFDK